MNIQDYLTPQNWSKKDLRQLKDSLTTQAQNELDSFLPLASSDYNNNPIQVIDFFCGAGGTSLGFAAVNKIVPAFKFLGGCDINNISASSYSKNFGTKKINRDIVELAYVEGELEKVLTEIGYNNAMPTVLIGCAPCQGFTSHRKRYWTEEDDGRNTLILAFAEIVKKISPDAIVMENVPEFLSKKYWQYFSTAKTKYESYGYTVKQSIYNAASFGVPQERFRTVVIGMKHNFVMPSGHLSPQEYRSVKDAIGMLLPLKSGEKDPNDPMHVAIAHKTSTLEVIKSVPHDGGSRPSGIGPACLDKVRGFYDVYGRLSWDRPSITITAFARNPASGRFTHPDQDRVITAREAATLQSFPRGFEFTGGSCDVFRQIGEAVPPKMSTSIAADVLIELSSCDPNSDEISKEVTIITDPVSSSYSSVIAGIKMRQKGMKR